MIIEGVRILLGGVSSFFAVLSFQNVSVERLPIEWKLTNRTRKSEGFESSWAASVYFIFAVTLDQGQSKYVMWNSYFSHFFFFFRKTEKSVGSRFTFGLVF